MPQQRHLGGHAAAKARQAAVGADHAVARHDDAERVATHGTPDRTRRLSASGPLGDAGGDVAVGRRAAVGDVQQLVLKANRTVL